MLDIEITEVTIDTQAVTEKVNNLLNDEVMLRIQTLFAETIDPWTPFLSGDLHSDITIDPTGVTYNVPYSAEKYYGTVYTKTFHPLATSHWDEVAMDTELAPFVEKVKDILIERANEIYG